MFFSRERRKVGVRCPFQPLSITDKMHQSQAQPPTHPPSPSVLTEPPLCAEPWAGPLGCTVNRTSLPQGRHDQRDKRDQEEDSRFLEVPSGNLKSRLPKDLLPGRGGDLSKLNPQGSTYLSQSLQRPSIQCWFPSP